MTDNRPIHTVPPEELVTMGKEWLLNEKQSHEQYIAEYGKSLSQEWETFYRNVDVALTLLKQQEG